MMRKVVYNKDIHAAVVERRSGLERNEEWNCVLADVHRRERKWEEKDEKSNVKEMSWNKKERRKKRDFVEDENDWSTRENFEEIKYNWDTLISFFALINENNEDALFDWGSQWTN